jgi:hypothetical protein
MRTNGQVGLPYMYVCCHAAASDMFLVQSVLFGSNLFFWAPQSGYSVTQTHPIVFSVSSLLMMIS